MCEETPRLMSWLSRSTIGFIVHISKIYIYSLYIVCILLYIYIDSIDSVNYKLTKQLLAVGVPTRRTVGAIHPILGAILGSKFKERSCQDPVATTALFLQGPRS